MARLFSNRFQCFVVWIFLTTKRNILLPVNASFYLCTRTPRNIWYVGRVEGSSSLWKTAPNSVEKGFRLHSSPSPLDDGEVDEQKFSVQLSETSGPVEKISDTVFHDTSKSVQFSFWMTLCGGILGPFLDSYHSAFSVLRYDDPIKFILSPLGGTSQYPVLTTAWWVPELFGLAGFLIGWLYILYDQIFQTQSSKTKPNAPFILTCISFFTFQYWLSGLLYQGHFDRSTILFVMSFMAATGFVVFDRTVAGLITSFSTAIGGPLIEVGLISMLTGNGGYHYTDPGETGFFPLWISPVYFLGGPAVGNLARGIWNLLSRGDETLKRDNEVDGPNCKTCNDTRAVGCPNCDALGYYISYNQKVKCNCCKGRGLVICRDCFSDYDNDPYDLQGVRDLMSRIPD